MTILTLTDRPSMAAGPVSIPARDRGSALPRSGWQDQAIATYHRTAPTSLLVQLVARVEALTGHAVAPTAAYVDPSARLAQVAVDGVLFRWQAGTLVVLRPCAGCGSELLASPAIADPADLGHALAGWVPGGRHCPPADPAED